MGFRKGLGRERGDDRVLVWCFRGYGSEKGCGFEIFDGRMEGFFFISLVPKRNGGDDEQEGGKNSDDMVSRVRHASSYGGREWRVGRKRKVLVVLYESARSICFFFYFASPSSSDDIRDYYFEENRCMIRLID